ncbi:MAG: sugar phosphate isomerase/epimerase [Clostridia bacterium]|nr:sugar phosphate isomerase/epimerase [Clostridia bacterium]
MKNLPISCATNLCPRAEGQDAVSYVHDTIRFYRECGLDTADFGTTMLDLTSEGWKPQVEAIMNDATAQSFQFYMGHLPFMGGISKNEEVMETFKLKVHNAIDAAAALGLQYAVMHPNAAVFPLLKYDGDEQRAVTLELLSPFVEHANRVGLNLVVENMRVVSGKMQSHRYCQTAEEVCDLADTLGIGICWDFGHANLSGLKQSKALEYVGKRLKVIHVNDNCGIEDDHVLPFSGIVNWKDAMHGLALTGFEGPFNFELNLGRVPATLRRDLAAYLMGIANELMSYIE